MALQPARSPGQQWLLPSKTCTTNSLLLPRTGKVSLAVVPMREKACFVVPVGYIRIFRLRAPRLACANLLGIPRCLKLHLASHTQHPWCARIRTVVIHWSQQSFSSSNVWLEWIPVVCSIYYIGEKNISSPPLSIPPLRSEGRNVTLGGWKVWNK